MSAGQPVVEHEAAEQRFVTRSGELVAELTYRRDGDRLVMEHTWVPVELRNQGIAGRLVEAAALYCQQEGLVAVAVCPFVRTWFRANPDRFPDLTVQ